MSGLIYAGGCVLLVAAAALLNGSSFIGYSAGGVGFALLLLDAPQLLRQWFRQTR